MNVVSEEAVLKWYTEAHLAKGKSVFLEQMKKFVEWLKNAEEGEYQSQLNMMVSLFSHIKEITLLFQNPNLRRKQMKTEPRLLHFGMRNRSDCR